ncbi:unnamed protein product [Rangifer tarandus platyrhynchus]|uniref:Uncharacterized protein n=1 Tax=Rangifer tarandus platyrhynchus TaxID=3082113 RepID=A0ABN8ZD26_RANTA|nr:unnamed protein product [Rangifer tarandus platyrhynchus]
MARLAEFGQSDSVCDGDKKEDGKLVRNETRGEKAMPGRVDPVARASPASSRFRSHLGGPTLLILKTVLPLVLQVVWEHRVPADARAKGSQTWGNCPLPIHVCGQGQGTHVGKAIPCAPVSTTHLGFRLNWDSFHSQVSREGSQQQGPPLQILTAKETGMRLAFRPLGLAETRPSLEKKNTTLRPQDKESRDASRFSPHFPEQLEKPWFMLELSQGLWPEEDLSDQGRTPGQKAARWAASEEGLGRGGRTLAAPRFDQLPTDFQAYQKARVLPHEDMSPEDHPKERSREWVLTECPLSVGPESAASWMSPSSLYEEEPRLPIPRLEGLKSTPFPPAVGTHTSTPSGFLVPRSTPSPALSQPLGLEGPHSGLQALLFSQLLQRELSAPAHAGVGVCKRSERLSFNDSSIRILEQALLFCLFLVEPRTRPLWLPGPLSGSHRPRLARVRTDPPGGDEGGFRRFVTGINTGQRPGSRAPGALRPASPALLRSWGRAGGGPGDQFHGAFTCPDWSQGGERGKLGAVPRKEPPHPHPTGIRGGGGRASPEYRILFVFSGPGMPRHLTLSASHALVFSNGPKLQAESGQPHTLWIGNASLRTSLSCTLMMVNAPPRAQPKGRPVYYLSPGPSTIPQVSARISQRSETGIGQDDLALGSDSPNHSPVPLRDPQGVI